MDEVFKASFDDSEIMAQLDRLEKQIVQTGRAVDTVGNTASSSLNQAAGAAQNFSNSMDAAAQQTAQQAKAVTDARAANQSWLQSVRQTIAGQQIAGKTLGEWGEQARGFAARITEGAGATGKFAGAWRIFSGVLKATGIGLIITAVASLISYFQKFQPLLDKVSQITAGFSAALSVVAERVIMLGNAFAKLFSGDFSGAWNTAGEAVAGFAGALTDAAIQAANLEARLQALRDVTITQSVEAARQRVEIEKLRAAVDDSTRSIGERAKASRQAGELERQIAAQAVDRALEAQQIAQQKFAIDQNNLALRQEAAKAEVEFQEAVIALNKTVSDTEKEQREFRKEAAEERKKAQEEEKKRVDALRKEYEKLFSSIKEQADKLEIENIFNPIEKVIAEFDAAKGQINELRERLLEIAPDAAARQRVEDEVERLFDQLLIKYREEYSAAADELDKLKGGKIREALLPLPSPDTVTGDIKFRVQGIVKSLQSAAQEAIEGQTPGERPSLAELLGLSPDQLEGVKDAAAQIIDSLNQISEARVREAEAATRAADERVKAAEDALEKEQELAAEGLANNVTLRQKELDAAKAAQQEAQKEQAKAVRTQILLDSAQQVSSLITATANIFKGFSTLPIVGQVLAIASIASMFAAFGAAKAQALKAAQIPKFRKGTKLEGRSHEAGGLAISDEYGNVVGEAEGGEWLIGTKPSREHDTFLKRLNTGEFSGVNLDRLIPRPSASNPITESAGRIERIEREYREIQTGQQYAAMVAAYEKSAGRIVEAIQAKEVVFPMPNGYKVKTRKGRDTEIEVVKFE